MFTCSAAVKAEDSHSVKVSDTTMLPTAAMPVTK
jgi:hypothetical protein